MASIQKYKNSISIMILIFLLESCSQPRTSPISTKPDDKILLAPIQFGSKDAEVIQNNLRASQQQLPAFLEKASFYQVEIVIADDYHSLTGKESIQYFNTEVDNLNEIYLQLFPNAFGPYLKINDARINGVSVQPVMQFHDTAAKFNLNSPLRPGEGLNIQLSYILEVPTDFTFSYGLFVYADEILSLYQFIPLIPVYNQPGWQVSEPNTLGDLTFNDVSFFEVQVDAPEGLTLAASGTRISEKVEKNRRLETFQAGPVRDFYLAGSTAFQVTSRKWQDVVINSYTPRDMQSGSDLVLAVAEHALEIYSKEFGPYPYNELDLVSAPMHDALGMEYSGIVAMSIDLYDPLAGVDTRSSLQFTATAAHEIAHQWFFNLIGSNQVTEPWLDEGMAQFACSLYFQTMVGDMAADQIRTSWEQRWQRIQFQQIPVGQSVSAYNDLQYSAIIYGRAPLFIQVLQEKMGGEKFSKFLSDYFQKFEWGITTTQDFRRTAEAACACSLESQFQEWVYPK
jgi:hypothetical protein